MALQTQVSVLTKQELYDNIGYGHGRVAALPGIDELGDTSLIFYIYDENSTATDDGDNVIKPTQVDEVEFFGRFLKRKVKHAEISDSVGKRIETYSGTTNVSGVYTETFSTAFSVAPNIQANIIGGTNTNLIKITSITTTGFTVTVVNRVDVLGLLPSYSNVNGASVDVLIIEK